MADVDWENRYARLDTFLDGLRRDVYPERPSSLHSSIAKQMFDIVVRDFGPFSGADVLDVGCGQGVALELFAAQGLHATGIALGEDVAICRAKGFKVVEMDLAFLDFPDASFDLVWCRHALEHSVFPFFTLHELTRVLRPGGVLYVEVPAPATSCRHETNPNHYSVLGQTMWKELIRRSGFPTTTCVELSFNTGAGPDAYWAFIQRKPNA